LSPRECAGGGTEFAARYQKSLKRVTLPFPSHAVDAKVVCFMPILWGITL
jgi:hypothetical protein